MDKAKKTELLAVAYGGGTNSSAMLCGLYEREIKPDIILFADTGSEMPHTYAFLDAMEKKVKEWWGMEIETVRALFKGKFEGLQGECLRLGTIPSLAYGMRSCSVKFKTEPQSRRLKKEMKHADIPHVRRAIGFGADEGHRVKSSTDDWATNWFPLVDWQWRRQECIDVIGRYGLPQPGKSACFFCPASKRSEVVRLKENHPELMEIALEMEAGVQKRNRSKWGLGGENNLWSDWLAMDEAQFKLGLDLEPVHMPCGCMDG